MGRDEAVTGTATVRINYVVRDKFDIVDSYYEKPAAVTYVVEWSDTVVFTIKGEGKCDTCR